MFVDILDRAFEIKPLLVSEFGGHGFVWRVIFRVLWIKKRVDSMCGWDGAISEVVSSVEFAHVESDWYEACNSFNTIRGGCLKSTSDPKICLVLYFF